MPRNPATGLPITPRIEVPTGFAAFARDIAVAPRRWIEAAHPRVEHYRGHAKGGHFPAWEVPEIFLDEARSFFRGLRSRDRRAD